MAKLTLNEDAEISPAKLKELQAAFNRIEAKAQKLKAMSKAMEKQNEKLDEYLSELHELGEELDSELSDFADNLLIDGNDFYSYEQPAATAAYAFNFWVPSSYGC